MISIQSKYTDKRAELWIIKQPLREWLPLNNIPVSIFTSVWNNYIEKSNVELHKTNPEYFIKRKIKTVINPKLSKYRGVHWNKTMNKWVSSIVIDYKKIHLGYFTNELNAADAYKRALKRKKSVN